MPGVQIALPALLFSITQEKNDIWISLMALKPKKKLFALCVESIDSEDLEKRKIYQVVFDSDTADKGNLRAVDESDEDYLCPESYFILVELPA